MKKVRGGNRKKRFLNKNKRFFKNKLPLFGLIATFLLAVFLFSVTGTSQPTGNVITENTVTGHEIDVTDVTQLQNGIINSNTTPFQSEIQTWFTKWEEKQLGANIIKYLFFFVLAGLIFVVLNFARFPPKTFFQILIALPAAFLATAYITPTEIFVIFQSYDALIVTLKFVLPFIVMIFVSAMLLSDGKIDEKKKTTTNLLVFFLWLSLLVGYGYNIIEPIVLGKIPWALNLSMFIMLFITGLCLLIVLFQKSFQKMIRRPAKEIRNEQNESAKEEQKNAMKTAEEVEKARK
jgi:hypothetical protein